MTKLTQQQTKDELERMLRKLNTWRSEIKEQQRRTVELAEKLKIVHDKASVSQATYQTYRHELNEAKLTIYETLKTIQQSRNTVISYLTKLETKERS